MTNPKFLTPANADLHPDEPAYQIHERVQKSDNSMEWRRFQYVFVVRNDRLVAYRIDLGPAWKMNGEPFSFVGGFVDPQTGRGDTSFTVNELQEVADKLRDRPNESDQIERRDWMKDLYEDLEQQQLAIRGATTSGALVTVQRSL
mgnify:CR=1 FL=1